MSGSAFAPRHSFLKKSSMVPGSVELLIRTVEFETREVTSEISPEFLIWPSIKESASQRPEVDGMIFPDAHRHAHVVSGRKPTLVPDHTAPISCISHMSRTGPT